MKVQSIPQVQVYNTIDKLYDPKRLLKPEAIVTAKNPAVEVSISQEAKDLANRVNKGVDND